MNTLIEYFLIVLDDQLDFDPGTNFPNFHRLRFSDYQLNIPKNSGYFLAHPQIQSDILSISNNHQVAIIPFKPNPKIEKICQKNQWLYVANPSSINRQLEDKINFAKLCDLKKIPTLPHYICHLNQSDFSHGQELLQSTKVVVQTRFGWAGNSTHLATSYQDLLEKLTDTTEIKMMPYVHGYTLLNNAVIHHHHLYYSPIGLQITGHPLLTRNPFATVGRQWPANIPPHVSLQVNKITEIFANILITDYQYRGFFGLDFFVDDNDQVFLLECNPRLTASFSFYTHLELELKLAPLFYLHLDEFTSDLNYQNSDDRASNQNIQGVELTARDQEGTIIRTFRQKTPLSQSPYDQFRLPKDF